MDATGDAAVSGPASTAGDDDEPLSGQFDKCTLYVSIDGVLEC